MGRAGVIGGVAVVGAATFVAAALASQSPQLLRASIVRATLAQRWVHYVETGTAPGLRQTMVCDVSARRGVQRITVRLHGKTGRFTVIVVGHTAYVRGDVPALHDYLGFPAARARKYAGRWISVPRTSRAYAAFAADVTLGSLVADHVPQSNLSTVSGTVGGRKVLGLRGTVVVAGVSSTTIVYVRSAAHPLPLETRDVSSQHGFRDGLALGPWNRPVPIEAPTHAVPISIVLGGSATA